MAHGLWRMALNKEESRQIQEFSNPGILESSNP